ncbi:hypothetical protein BN1708_002152, partial [Verticillium longisporum]
MSSNLSFVLNKVHDVSFEEREVPRITSEHDVLAKGSFRYGPGDYKLAIDLVANGSVNVKKLISEVVSFREAEDAFKKVKQGQVIKVLIKGPNEQ